MDDDLTHAYDAAKRREYYLRNRKLKGRHHGSVKISPPRKTRAQRQAEQRKHQEAQIAALKGRLEKLQKILAEEVKKAKARSGVKSEKPEAKKTDSPKKAPVEKLTAKQKADKAKADKKRHDKNPDLALDEQVKSLTQKIKNLQERIAKMRKDGSVGARKSSVK